MGLRGLFEGWHVVILVVVVVLVFGWKRLPDAARSLGRSMRIFKAEFGETKNDAKPHQPSAAASDTVRGQTVQQPPTAAGTTPPVPSTPPAAPVDDPTLTPPATHSAAPGSQPSQQPPA